MKRGVIILSSAILFFLMTGCDFINRTPVIEEELCIDAECLDSLRRVKCDSLFFVLRENRSSIFKEIPKTPTSIEESILLLNETLNDSIKEWIRCADENSFENISHFGLGMYIRNKWGLWASSELAKEFPEHGIMHPDYMSPIILSCLVQYVKNGTHNLSDELKKVVDGIREEEEFYNNQNIEYDSFCVRVDSINKSIRYDENLRKVPGLVRIGETNDFYILRKNKDTIEHSFTRQMNSTSLEKYTEIVRGKNFYNSVFYGGVSDIGKIELWTLKKERFIKRAKEIYFELYTDSFVKIFSKEMIANTNYTISIAAERDCQFSSSYLKFQWQLEGRDYYYFIIEGSCGSHKIRRGFYLDENLNLVFNKSIQFKLNNAKVIYHMKSDDE